MQVIAIISAFMLGALAAPEARFSCQECVREMHGLGNLVYYATPDIQAYLSANYCPTLDDYPHCEEDLPHLYPRLLGAVVNHFFVDGAVHVCQTGGLCEVYAKEYTCDECVAGLHWVEQYLEDPIQVAEYSLWLLHNLCTTDECRDVVAEHWPAMHWMAMEKFMIPGEICNQEPVCTGEDPPTRPPQ